TESEITRERLALEESIRKVEAEAARKARIEMPRIDPVTVTRPPEAPRRDEKPLSSLFAQPPASPARETPARERAVPDTPPREAASQPRAAASGVREAASDLRAALSSGRDAASPPREPPTAKRETADRPSKDQPARRGFLPEP